jgi:hypothetical protein
LIYLAHDAQIPREYTLEWRRAWKHAGEAEAGREEVTEMRGLNPSELFWGFLLVVVGGLLLLEALGVFAIGDVIIPIVVVLIGLFLVFRAFSSDRTPRPHA